MFIIISCHFWFNGWSVYIFRLYVDPMLSTDGASADDKAMTVTPIATTDGL